MWFKMINESFTCENCSKTIEIHPEGSARNHCPFCLHSKHMDLNFPGDRASTCLWIMKPIDIDHKKNKGWMVKHSCIKCNKEMLNKVAPDDNFLDFIEKRNKII